ncbi:LysR substrate-binding domain-containing protein [Nocardia gamkensis]|uniref:LysR substrate-binding domain-containing protein n=1 Tax=Nocardia gamkensis TaxID=352869 RepID=UPI0037C5962E
MSETASAARAGVAPNAAERLGSSARALYMEAKVVKQGAAEAVTERVLAEVADAEFVTMHHGFGMRRIFDELCAAADIRPRIAFESSDLVAVAGLVSAGLGLAILPGEDPLSAGPLSGPATVPLADAGAARAVGLVWSAAATPPDAVRRFRDFTEDWARRRGGIP